MIQTLRLTFNAIPAYTKYIIVDEERVFITSAKFAEAAMNTNIKLVS